VPAALKHQERVLIVDDELIARKVLNRVLTNAGFYVADSSNGISALSRLVTMKFDAVTVDLRMPVISGLDLLEKIKERHPDIAVIIVTAVDDVSTAVECMKKGADDYLTKPFDLKIVPGIISRAIQKRERELARKEHSLEVEHKLHSLTVTRDIEKGDLLKTFAQQVRTPLTAVITSSELLLDAVHAADEKQLRTLTGNIKRSAWALNDSINHLTRQAQKGPDKQHLKENN
jgi:two-component system nitrogen regulation response regulator GlnG